MRTQASNGVQAAAWTQQQPQRHRKHEEKIKNNTRHEGQERMGYGDCGQTAVRVSE